MPTADDIDIPDFLRIPQEQRRAAWRGRKLTSPRDQKVPAKDEDAATKALRRETAVAEEAKKAARFARLNELKQERTTAMKTPTKKLSKSEQVASLRTRGAEAKGPKPAKKAAAVKKTAKTRARMPTAAKPANDAPKVVRTGSKLEIVVGLLKRKEGCTSAEILAATDWPAVSVPQQARAAGLTLRQEKDGKVTRYWAI